MEGERTAAVKYLLQRWWMPAKWSLYECLMFSSRERKLREIREDKVCFKLFDP